MIHHHDMPPDPDYDDVPANLRALDGQLVTVTHADGTTTTQVFVIAPSLFAHARRLRDGFYEEDAP